MQERPSHDFYLHAKSIPYFYGPHRKGGKSCSIPAERWIGMMQSFKGSWLSPLPALAYRLPFWTSYPGSIFRHRSVLAHFFDWTNSTERANENGAIAASVLQLVLFNQKKSQL